MSSLWDVPQYLIMAFSLALHAPAEKASRVSLTTSTAIASAAAASAGSVPDETFWLRAVKLAAPYSDVLAAYGQRIFVTSSGRYYVPAESDRADILALRRNRDVTTRVLAAATAHLHDELERRSELVPTTGALLIAHVAGLETALAYLRALDASPSQRAARAVPQLARFMDGEMEMTLAQLEARLARSVGAAPSAQVAVAETALERNALKGTLNKPDAASAAPSRLANR